ncbi:hypothetical protein VNI00_010474 [Paramarasmius palmivorus]|uniref:Uncharacterized protein n=1 Tax=Paramarasmius palmivorus TaxID=297713 RepID=A0AAW0CJD5_9AGAR
MFENQDTEIMMDSDTSDLYVLGNEHAQIPKDLIRNWTHWEIFCDVPSGTIKFLREIGIQDTDNFQSLSLQHPSIPYSTRSLPLGHFLGLRRGAQKFLGGDRRPRLRNPFFTWVSARPEYVPPEDCHGFLYMPIDRLLFHSQEKTLLAKLQASHVNDASLLTYLSWDHITAIGLTEEECSRLREVGERDAVRGSFLVDGGLKPSGINFFQSDLWVLGHSERGSHLPPSVPLDRWCRNYGVEREALDCMINLGLRESKDLRFLFVPRIPLGYFLILRRAATSWLTSYGLNITMDHPCWRSNPVALSNMSVADVYHATYEETTLFTLLNNKVHNMKQLKYLSHAHLRALGWTKYDFMRLSARLYPELPLSDLLLHSPCQDVLPLAGFQNFSQWCREFGVDREVQRSFERLGLENLDLRIALERLDLKQLLVDVKRPLFHVLEFRKAFTKWTGKVQLRRPVFAPGTRIAEKHVSAIEGAGEGWDEEIREWLLSNGVRSLGLLEFLSMDDLSWSGMNVTHSTSFLDDLKVLCEPRYYRENGRNGTEKVYTNVQGV